MKLKLTFLLMVFSYVSCAVLKEGPASNNEITQGFKTPYFAVLNNSGAGINAVAEMDQQSEHKIITNQSIGFFANFTSKINSLKYIEYRRPEVSGGLLGGLMNWWGNKSEPKTNPVYNDITDAILKMSVVNNEQNINVIEIGPDNNVTVKVMNIQDIAPTDLIRALDSSDKIDVGIARRVLNLPEEYSLFDAYSNYNDEIKRISLINVDAITKSQVKDYLHKVYFTVLKNLAGKVDVKLNEISQEDKRWEHIEDMMNKNRKLHAFIEKKINKK